MKKIALAFALTLVATQAFADCREVCYAAPAGRRVCTVSCKSRPIFIGMCDCYWKCVHYDRGHCVIWDYLCPRCPWRD